jgi:hypothetical protein
MLAGCYRAWSDRDQAALIEALSWNLRRLILRAHWKPGTPPSKKTTLLFGLGSQPDRTN